MRRVCSGTYELEGVEVYGRAHRCIAGIALQDGRPCRSVRALGGGRARCDWAMSMTSVWRKGHGSRKEWSGRRRLVTRGLDGVWREPETEGED